MSPLSPVEQTQEKIRKVLKRLDPKTVAVVFAIRAELTKWTSQRAVIRYSAPGADTATLATAIRVDELRILSQMKQFPDSPFTLPWAGMLEGSCRTYSYDHDGTHMFYARSIGPRTVEAKLARPDRYMGAHHTWRVISILENEPHGLGPLPSVHGAIMYHDFNPNGPGGLDWGLEFPSLEADNPLLDGERILGLMLLSRQRTHVSNCRAGKIRIASVTHSAIRIILVTLDPIADQTIVPVTFRILKTVRITQDMTQHNWDQLVFLTMNRELDLSEGTIVGGLDREGSPQGQPTMALRVRAGADDNCRVVARGPGLPAFVARDSDLLERSRGGEQ